MNLIITGINVEEKNEFRESRGKVQGALRSTTRIRDNVDKDVNGRSKQRDNQPYQRIRGINERSDRVTPETHHRNTNQNKDHQEDSIPNCECGKASLMKTVRKDGPNNGKTFYGCGQDTRCQFFKWT